MNSAIIVNKSLTPTIANVGQLSCAIISLTPRKPKSIPEAVAEAGRGCVAIDCLSVCVTVCLQVWNHNLVVDTFLGQMSVPILGDKESPAPLRGLGKTKFTASCCFAHLSHGRENTSVTWCMKNKINGHSLNLEFREP